MLTPHILVRGRYRAGTDTLALEADLSEHPIAETIRQDHDVDQVVEWVRLAADDTVVFHRAQLLHVRPLERLALLVDLPLGAAEVVALLRDLAAEEGCEFSEVAVHRPLHALACRPHGSSGASAGASGPAAATGACVPADEGPATTAAGAAPIPHLTDDELRARTTTGAAATHAAVRELLACREDWPDLHLSGALLHAWEAVAVDTSLGGTRFDLVEDLFAMASAPARHRTRPGTNGPAA
jgi:hypothetical protein